MSQFMSAMLGVAMTVAFFYHSLTGGLIFATLLLFYLLRHAPKQVFDDTQKDATSCSRDASNK